MNICRSLILVILLPGALSAQTADTARRDLIALPVVQVIGDKTGLARVPGSATLIKAEAIRMSQPRDINELLRGVPGIVAREEDGLGLRPNIGIRGASPTRSSKVLLLEDGVPFTIAPYGDNATYYHPPIERFDRVEIVKGSGQILYGPHTIGGVINYLSPELQPGWNGRLSTAAGGRGYFRITGRGEASLGGVRGRLDYLRKQERGFRENIGSTVEDIGTKWEVPLGSNQSVRWRANHYAERSRVTYSGLTEAEYLADRRQNPFRNDSMRLDRWATAVVHRASLGGFASLSTTAYGYLVARDWWRQSSNSAQRPNDASDPRCGGLVNLSTTCGNEGRLRDYAVVGIEPRFQGQYQVGSVPVLLDVGARYHHERQNRSQVNGGTPNARKPGETTDPNAGVREDNLRTNDAYAGFVQQRWQFGRLTITPGARIEHVRYQRTNRLAAGAPTGHTRLTAVIPGLGATWLPTDRATLFAGVHRGFSPPRTEDLLDNSGRTVDLEAESSWNYELGVRARFGQASSVETSLFAIDYSNQIIPASVAGGAGANLTSAGETRHAGLEVGVDISIADLGIRLPVEVSAAYTHLAVARFAGQRYAFVGTVATDGIGKVFGGQDASGSRQRVSVAGNRLPYAPRHQLTAALAVRPSNRARLRIESVLVGRMFGDVLNTPIRSPDGQQGPLEAWAVWNLAASHELSALKLEIFASVKNLFDRTYIADRSRGILPGLARTVSVGVTHRL